MPSALSSLPELGAQKDGGEEAGSCRIGLVEDRGAVAQQRQAQRLPQLLAELRMHTQLSLDISAPRLKCT